MNYAGTLIVVRDPAQSARWYAELLELQTIADYGANIALSGGLSLQSAESWKALIGAQTLSLPDNAAELYFEEEDLDVFLARLEAHDVRQVHPPRTQRWGQRVLRFYDPDGHIIEVGEPLRIVVARFYGDGMCAEQIAQRMEVPLDFVRACLASA
ncbi:MAG: VOC family protein [Oscillospiraceae bacterium]|nr:VOC family protein [Oscillospiraceae bacterium]